MVLYFLREGIRKASESPDAKFQTDPLPTFGARPASWRKIAIALIDMPERFECIHSTYVRSIHQTRNIATMAPAM
jgi:hypothetical protein